MTIVGTTLDGNRQDYTPPSDESASVGIEYLVLMNAGQEPLEFGLDGNDQIALNEYNPSVADSDRADEGGAGNDTLLGNRGNDVVLGQDGNDLLIVNNGDGSDFLEGGEGGTSNASLEAQGLDVVVAATTTETSIPGRNADDSNDFVFGENGNDLIVHNSVADVLDFTNAERAIEPTDPLAAASGSGGGPSVLVFNATDGREAAGTVDNGGADTDFLDGGDGQDSALNEFNSALPRAFLLGGSGNDLSLDAVDDLAPASSLEMSDVLETDDAGGNLSFSGSEAGDHEPKILVASEAPPIDLSIIIVDPGVAA